LLGFSLVGVGIMRVGVFVTVTTLWGYSGGRKEEEEEGGGGGGRCIQS